MISPEYVLLNGPGRYLCPDCEGGSSREKSLNIWRSGWEMLAKCHRAGCGAFAKYPVRDYQEGPMAAHKPPEEVLRPYTGDRFPLTRATIDRFEAKYGFLPRGMSGVAYTTTLDQEPILIPILAPNGQERGVVRRILGDVPRGTPKSVIYKAKDEPMISWSPRAYGEAATYVLLVEDQISALKWRQVREGRACALLGTNLTTSAVAEIQRHAKHVTIALDADATAKAFLLARKWGHAFSSCKVMILQRDIKDMSAEDIAELPL